MGQILHGSATTTHAVRAAIRRSEVCAVEQQIADLDRVRRQAFLDI